MLTGLDPDVMFESVRFVVNHADASRSHEIPKEYQIANTSHWVAKLILGTAKLSGRWDGIILPGE